jgi:carbon monoxide dehydrogenase subunit G
LIVTTVENSSSIARPPGDVFAFVSDVRNEPRWHTDLLEARLTSEGPIGTGSTFAVRLKSFMGRSEGTLTLSEYEPPRRAVFLGQMGKMAPTVILTVEPEGQGSRFTRRVDMEMPGPMRLMVPFMHGMLRKRNAGFAANLKRVLETG